MTNRAVLMRRRTRLALIAGLLLLAGGAGQTVTATRVTVATTQTLIYTGAAGGSTVLLRNPGTVSVYLGPTGVLTTTGFELAAGDAITIAMGPNDPLYGIVASGTNIVHVLETRR